MSDSLKKSLNKLNKTGQIKKILKGFQKRPGPQGIKGLSPSKK